MTDNPFDGWLTIAEAAAKAGVSSATISRRIKRGEIEWRKITGRVLVRESSIDYEELRQAKRGPANRHWLGGLDGGWASRTKTLTFSASPAEEAWVTERCREHGLSRSNLIRAALNATYGNED